MVFVAQCFSFLVFIVECVVFSACGVGLEEYINTTPVKAFLLFRSITYSPLFFREQILDEKDAWYCSSCKCFQRASKEMGLWTAPDNLIIHIKRFSQQEGAYSLFSSDKVESLVTFPLEGLDMSPYVLSRAFEVGSTFAYQLQTHF